MLPFLLFVAVLLVCVGMYIGDHRRAVAREKERHKSDSNERRRTIIIGLFALMLFTSLLTGCALESTAPPTPTAGPQISGKAMGAQQAITAASYTLTGACSSNNGFGYLAITSGGTIWVAQGNTSWTVSTTTTAAPGTSTNITTNSVGTASYKESGVVIDSSQNAWVIAYDSSTKANQLAAWDSTQTPLTNSPWATSVPGPYAIGSLSIDGANLLWGTATYGPVSILTSSPSSSLTKISNTAYLQGQCIPDQSGNVWCDIAKGLIMYPGIATPTANPVSPSNHGTKP